VTSLPKLACSVASDKDVLSAKKKDASPEVKAALQALIDPKATTVGGVGEAGIAQVTKDMLLADPETAEQLKRYEQALARVEAAKAAAAELEDIFAQGRKELAAQQEVDAAARNKADEMLAQAEIEAAEKLVLAAQLEAAAAERRALSLKSQIVDDAERIESAKAGVLAIIGGLAVVAPLLIASQVEGSGAATTDPVTLGLTVTSTLASCFLFGPTYRYAVRYDSSNSHLRGGVVAAFGLVRAAANAEALATASAAGPLDLDTVVGPGLLYAGESMLLFAFAATALEAAFKWGWIKRFGMPAGTSSLDA